MSDISQGDGELFHEATTDLEKFENPELPLEQPKQEPPPQTPPPTPPTEPQPDAQVPSGRFREESERRRQAEREAQDLRARLAAFEVQPRQAPQPEKKLDIFDNPDAWFEQKFKPYFEEQAKREQARTEATSSMMAVMIYGQENVSGAYAALQSDMGRHDPNAWATYNRAMASHDPYGVITRWHLDRGILQETGGDLNAYKQKLREDPEFQKQVIEAMKGTAPQVNRPITQSKVPNLPSLSDIGAAGGDEGMQDNLSDEALFRAAVSAKRRRN